MGTEIRTFNKIKEFAEYLTEKTLDYQLLYEDYGQWLGNLLRTCEKTHENEEWVKRASELQKKIGSKKKTSEKKNKKGKKKKSSDSVWVESDNIMISSNEQGQAEILFEVLEKINEKIQEIEKLKGTIKQLERMGLGKSTKYLVYIENEIPKKIVLQISESQEEPFKFSSEFTIPALFSYFSQK